MTDTTAPAAGPAGGMDAIFAEVGITDADFGAPSPSPAPEPDAASDAAPAPEADAPPAGPARDERGRFAPKEAAPEDAAEAPPKPAEAAPMDAPAPAQAAPPPGLSEAARAAWAQTPDAVRADVARRFREMETGLKGYQAEFGDLKPYAELARSQGTTLKAAMDRYVGIERMLEADPIGGLAQIARNLGIDPAKAFAGAPEQQEQAAQDAGVIAALRADLADLKRGFGGIRQTFEKQRQQQTLAEVEAFAQAHPRFEELSDTIAQMLRTGFRRTLAEAYEAADRLNPAPPPPPAPAPAPQTRKAVANLSVSGAPASGSNPATRKPPANKNDHMAEIFRQVGIS